MTPKLWQENLELKFSKDVLDIVQFGSSLIENKVPNDIDIAVIFKNIPIKEQLNLSQNIKKQIQNKTNLPIHISSFDLYSFFDEGNFAKESILFYGRSLLTKDYFAKYLGFVPKVYIQYCLENLQKKDKVRFHYQLQGKKGKYGLLKKYGGKLLTPGLIEIYPEYEEVFISAIQKIIENYKIKKTLILIQD